MLKRLPPVVHLFAAFALLTIAWTWPLVTRVDRAFLQLTARPSPLVLADHYLTSWILSWGAHQLRHDPLALFEANVFYPFAHSLAFSEHLLAGALLVLPFDVLHPAPVLDHNLLLLASFALGGSGTALLVGELGGSATAAVLAGALFAFAPLRLAQLGHVHVLSTHWMPFTLLFLHRFLATGRWWEGAAFVAAFLLAMLSSVYYAYFFGTAVLLFLALHAAWRLPVAPRARRRALALIAGSCVALVPTMLPYAAVHERYGLARDPVEALVFSAVGEHYLGAFLTPLTYLRGRYFEGRIQIPVIGMATLPLAVLGLVRGARSDRGGRAVAGLYASLAIAMALVSFGPVMHLHATIGPGPTGPYAFLARVVPGFDALRVPVRAAAVAVLALATLAGLGADVFLSRLPRRVGLAVASLVVLVECWRPTLFAVRVEWPDGALATYRWLAAQPESFPVVELPIGIPDRDALAMMGSTVHWKPLVNGYSGFSPAGAYTRAALAAFPDAESLRLLSDLGVRYAILHRSGLPPATGALCETGERHLPVRYANGDTCVLDILGAPPRAAPAPDHPAPLGAARLTTSLGTDPHAMVDRDLSTHWVAPVRRGVTDYVQIDLLKPRPLTRLVVRLGPHFGEYLRSFRVDASADGQEWTTLVDRPIGEAPLRGLVTNPDDLRVEIVLPPTSTAHLRLVRPAGDTDPDWRAWGIHELELFESASP